MEVKMYSLNSYKLPTHFAAVETDSLSYTLDRS